MERHTIHQPYIENADITAIPYTDGDDIHSHLLWPQDKYTRAVKTNYVDQFDEVDGDMNEQTMTSTNV